MTVKGKKPISWKWVTITIIALAVVSGTISALYQTNPSEPIPPKGITIKYTYTTMDSVSSWKADAGKTLLVVNMTIENHGYDSFYLDPSNFEAVVDSVVYRHSIITHFLDDVGYIPMQPVYLLDKGKVVCAIAFEIPKDYQSISLRHIWALQYNIEWVSA
ncbi:MAG: DUF4352 domain-containing protein [Nitrososphaerales archaeon]